MIDSERSGKPRGDLSSLGGTLLTLQPLLTGYGACMSCTASGSISFHVRRLQLLYKERCPFIACMQAWLLLIDWQSAFSMISIDMVLRQHEVSSLCSQQGVHSKQRNEARSFQKGYKKHAEIIINWLCLFLVPDAKADLAKQRQSTSLWIWKSPQELGNASSFFFNEYSLVNFAQDGICQYSPWIWRSLLGTWRLTLTWVTQLKVNCDWIEKSEAPYNIYLKVT